MVTLHFLTLPHQLLRYFLNTFILVDIMEPRLAVDYIVPESLKYIFDVKNENDFFYCAELSKQTK
jgi:hypothetical protein